MGKSKCLDKHKYFKRNISSHDCEIEGFKSNL